MAVDVDSARRKVMIAMTQPTEVGEPGGTYDSEADLEMATAATAGEVDSSTQVCEDDTAAAPSSRGAAIAVNSRSTARQALVLGLVIVSALAGLVGWLGLLAYQDHRLQQQRALFVQVGRQGALNLTTISHTRAEADVQRILDSATGVFYEEFQQRSQPFVDTVKQAQSETIGTVTEAGLESVNGDSADVLVAVTVTSTNAGSQEQHPRAWRMRLGVQKDADGAKVSNVEFVP